jgi:hypothetical protein
VKFPQSANFLPTSTHWKKSASGGMDTSWLVFRWIQFACNTVLEAGIFHSRRQRKRWSTATGTAERGPFLRCWVCLCVSVFRGHFFTPPPTNMTTTRQTLLALFLCALLSTVWGQNPQYCQFTLPDGSAFDLTPLYRNSTQVCWIFFFFF